MAGAHGFGWRCLIIRDDCMDFKPCFKVHNLVSVYPKSIKLCRMTTLDVIFHVVVSRYWSTSFPQKPWERGWVLINSNFFWNSSQFPAQFRYGYSLTRAFLLGSWWAPSMYSKVIGKAIMCNFTASTQLLRLALATQGLTMSRGHISLFPP